MEEIYRLVIVKALEAVYFSLFLIIGKGLKNKRILLTFIMIAEYLLLKQFIRYNVLFQFIYTILSFINLKVLYKEKAQITDVFLFTTASILLIFFSFICYLIVALTIKNLVLTVVLNRIVIFTFLFLFRKQIKEIYKEFYSLWNRHNQPNKIKSLTLRNISIISINVMFWVINLGMVIAEFL